MPEQVPYTTLVTEVLRLATRPLTVNEILARMAAIRPVETGNPAATVRGAMSSEHCIVTLGGRPAHYTWWPRHLAGGVFRQPLGAADLGEGTVPLTEEVFYALWPDFHAASSRSGGQVTLDLEGGPLLTTEVTHLMEGQALWGFRGEPALTAWLDRQGASLENDLIVRVVDVDAGHYAMSLARAVDPEAVRARNQALLDVAERVLRAGRDDMPYFQLIPRLIAHGAYRDPVPPEPVEEVLRADLRFAADADAVSLTERVVARFEREMEVLPAPGVPPPPAGRPPWRGKGAEGYSERARRAWAAYLVARGIDHQRIRPRTVAEAYWRLALQVDPAYVRARADDARH